LNDPEVQAFLGVNKIFEACNATYMPNFLN
jgi:carboxypeptidase C (cathepsin A)